MLSLVGSGWAKIQYRDFTGYCSYLTEVPVDILNGCIDYLDARYCGTSSIFFDEEGSEFTLMIGRTKSVIIAERETTEIYVVDMDYQTLMSQLISDIETVGVGKWAKEFSFDVEDVSEMETTISVLLETLKETLRER